MGGSSTNFYARDARSAARGTVVPGMMGGSADLESMVRGPREHVKKNIQPGKPVVGFLYSISRTPAGEFWPLHIGENTIGQSANSNIKLPEGTVSGNHASIIVRQLKNTGGIIAAIADERSTNGTMLNGETIGFSPVECHNNDVITIGDNYELVLILIDVSKFNLSVAQNFVLVDIEEDEEDSFETPPPFKSGDTRQGGFDPYTNNGPTPWGTQSYSSDGTVGMDGSRSGNNRGGTIPM